MQRQTNYLQQVLEGALRQPLPVPVRLFHLPLTGHQLVAVHLRQPLMPVRFLHLTLTKHQLVAVHLRQTLKAHLAGNI